MSVAVECARRACERRAREVGLELRRGLHGLAAVSGTAFFFATFWSLLLLVDVFCCGNGEKTAILIAFWQRLSIVLDPTALGLAVALLAWLARRWMDGVSKRLEDEMRCETLTLLNRLEHHCP